MTRTLPQLVKTLGIPVDPQTDPDVIVGSAGVHAMMNANALAHDIFKAGSAATLAARESAANAALDLVDRLMELRAGMGGAALDAMAERDVDHERATGDRAMARDERFEREARTQ